MSKQAKKYWWSAFVDVDPADESEQYPDPGSMLTFFLERAGYQKLKAQMDRISELLGVASSTAYNILQGRHLDAISRRRLLAEALGIYPALLELDARPHQPQWWHEQGYAFEAGEDGSPRLKEVITHFRKQKLTVKTGRTGKKTKRPWSRVDLALALGITRKGELEMEQGHIDSLKRRRALALVLGIPAALLGLDDAGHHAVMALPNIIIGRTIDVPSYFPHLERAYSSYYTNHGQEALSEASSQLVLLKQDLPFARTEQDRRALAGLQAHWHQFIASVSRELRDYKTGFSHSKQALALAEGMSDMDLLVSQLVHRSGLFRQSGDLVSARKDIDRALSIIHPSPLPPGSTTVRPAISPQVRCAMLRAAGVVYAYSQDKKDVMKAFTMLDEAYRMAQDKEAMQDDKHYWKINPGFILIYTAQALSVATPAHRTVVPSDREHVLDEARRLTPPELKRRHILLDMFECQEYINAGEYEDATSLALTTLDMARSINSVINRDRLRGIYQQLMETNYKDEPELARLGVRLLKWK